MQDTPVRRYGGLKDQDRIFTNAFCRHDHGLKGAQVRFLPPLPFPPSPPLRPLPCILYITLFITYVFLECLVPATLRQMKLIKRCSQMNETCKQNGAVDDMHEAVNSDVTELKFPHLVRMFPFN